VARRKEEKERLRQERLEAERQAEAAARRRLVIGYVAAGVLGVAVVIGIVFTLAGIGDDGEAGGTEASGENVNMDFGGSVPAGVRVDERVGTPPPAVETGDLTAAAEAAGCELRLDLDDEGSTHLDPREDKLPDYATNPPTSGDHYPVPLADGAFLDKPSPGSYVHSLEHGRVIIQYSPELPEEDQLALKGVFDDARPGVDLFPDPDMPDDVAVTAWTQLMTCDTYEGAATLDAIRAFRDAYLGRGPEAIPY
jgi:hypothetical protein